MKIDELLKQKKLCGDASFCDDTLDAVLHAQEGAEAPDDTLADSLLRAKLEADYPRFVDETMGRIRKLSAAYRRKTALCAWGAAAAFSLCATTVFFAFNAPDENADVRGNYSYFFEISERAKEITDISKLLVQEETLSIFEP